MSERAPTGFVQKYPLIPEEFGDYDRLDYGHPGGMGVVYKVLNRKLNAERALKVLRPDVADRMSVREAFIREANLGAQLAGGPYILPVHTVGTLQGWDFFEMDWIEGPNLAEFLRERGKLDPWVALTIGAMVLDALSFAHRQKIRYPDGSTKEGIVHRDIKPANILIDTRTCRPLLSDFGIALARDAAKDRQTGSTAGTINYLPPELIQDRPVDERSDIYQVGLVLYELLTGKRTFPGGAGEGVNGNILAGYKSKRAIKLSQHDKKLEPAVIAIVERSLEVEPNDRVQSAGAMRDQIRDYMSRRYVPHDPQQAFEKYLNDGSIPSRRISESQVFKGAKKQAPKVMWGLLALVVILAGLWGGRYLYVRHMRAEYQKERDNCASEKAVWDAQQPQWSASQIDDVSRKWQEIGRLVTAGEYRQGRDLAIALANQLRQEVEPLRAARGSAKAEFDAELAVFQRQKWPEDISKMVQDAVNSLSVPRPNFTEEKNLYESEFKFLAHQDSLKAGELLASADRKEVDRKYWANRFKGKPCGDSANALATALSEIRDRHNSQRTYEDGIAELNGIKIPGAGWNCFVPPEPELPCVASTRSSLDAAKADLAAFKNRAGWEQHAQSRQFANCSIKAVEDWLSQSAQLIRVNECEGALTRIDSAEKGLKQLISEWPPPPPPIDSTKIDTTITPDSAYVLGGAAYNNRRWEEVCGYMEQVQQGHEMYREARLKAAEARCMLGKFDEVTLDSFYREAGPLVYRQKSLSFTNMLRCFRKLGMCDSVDFYFDKAIGTGEMIGLNDARYANALYGKILCDYSRYASARSHGDEEQQMIWAGDVLKTSKEFQRYFADPKWRSLADEIKSILNDVHID